MKVKKFPVTFSLLILLVFILVSGVFADRDKVVLKNGRQISGYLREITDREVVLEIGMGNVQGNTKLRISKEDVENINNLSLEEAQARLATEEAFLLQDKNKAILSSAKEGFNFVSKTRKLEFKSIPEIEVTTKDRVKEQLKKDMEKYFKGDKLEIRGKLLRKLGIISKDIDYAKEVEGALGEEVAGFYDPDSKKIFVLETSLYGTIPGLPSITLMHEQVHALQDQYYDLKKMLDPVILLEDEDRALAIRGVVEGEATVLMYDAFLRGLGVKGKEQSFDLRSFTIDSMLAYSKRFKTEDGQPAIFMEDLLFPYVWGGSFIQHLVNMKGWEAVDTIYKDMPVSSEQIMHPEKYYITRDNPKKVTLPDVSTLLGKPWVRLSKGTLGEFGIYLIGRKFLDELSNKIMSEGWGGDCFELYEEPNSKQAILISLSEWDSEQDANEFFSIYKKIIEKKYEQVNLVKESDASIQWKIEQENVYICKFNHFVVIIEGAIDEALPVLVGSVHRP